MAMNETNEVLDEELDLVFQAARNATVCSADPLVSRVISDAQQVMQARPRPSGIWSALISDLGGRFGMGGLAFAAMVGLLIGMSGSADMITPSGFGAEEEVLTVFLSDYDLGTEEG